MAYLRGLSQDYAITLITYEKDEDRADSARMAAARAECEALGIRWLPQRFRPHPKVIAPALSMSRMIWLVRREVQAQNIQLIHARSYIPAAVAMAVSRMTGAPFIFDMRALWPEELITAGRLRRGSVLHRRIVAAERICLRRAAGVVSLTHAAAEHLRRIYPEELKDQRLVVIPTCADLDRFVPAASPPARRVIGCLGTMLSGWFRVDWLRAFLEAGLRRDPTLEIELTTRDDPGRLREVLGPVLAERLVIAPARPDEVPAVLQGQFASVMFFTDGLGKLGSSPTRMGETLGCGLPVVANEGVGDVARIIREHRVGILVRSAAPQDMESAWVDLEALLTDPGLAARCRSAAEAVFSLSAGTDSYQRLYADILGGRPPDVAKDYQECAG
ncbi:glycosyltransferase [Paracoccus sp. SJTW-4]|uniref:glycosyltransferase n=1 Tax=Paracoccus sp. SJTW-4 TaxID=3078428 RepID=UPI0039E76C2D